MFQILMSAQKVIIPVMRMPTAPTHQVASCVIAWMGMKAMV